MTTSSYNPIQSYGMIGNCHSALLISPDGSIDWGCLPDFDSPAIFCRLLDSGKGGYFKIAPTESTSNSSQRYLEHSGILETRFLTTTGELCVTDFMPVETLRAWPYCPMNSNSWAQPDGHCHSLVRMIECAKGTVNVTITYMPTMNFAKHPTYMTQIEENKDILCTNNEEYAVLSIVGAEWITPFHSTILHDKVANTDKLRIQCTLQEGEKLTIAMGQGKTEKAALALLEEMHIRNFTTELLHTLHCWRKWCTQSTYNGVYHQSVERSAITLKMLTYAPTGAIVAAPTTSLPEEIGGVRNWDYRYTWIRDASFTLDALFKLGFTEEGTAFMHWLRNVFSRYGCNLNIMYSIHGDYHLQERILDHLSGYMNSSPVRIGNEASEQIQMDIFGEMLDCLYQYRQRSKANISSSYISELLWEHIQEVVNYVCEHWTDKDNGIWEVRASLQDYVYSKVMCWVALDRAIAIAQEEHLPADREYWLETREKIYAEVLQYGYKTEEKVFSQTYKNTELDASNLMIPLTGFISAHDERMKSTIEETIKHLTDSEGFVYRYHTEDGLAGEDHGTFSICTFWLIQNLLLIEKYEQARTLFEKMLQYASALGLFTEEINTKTGEGLGNYPQALTHIALIQSALQLEETRHITQKLPVLSLLEVSAQAS